MIPVAEWYMTMSSPPASASVNRPAWTSQPPAGSTTAHWVNEKLLPSFAPTHTVPFDGW